MDNKEIKSSQNETYKLIKSLKDKKWRDNYSLFFIEGARFVEESLNNPEQIKWLLFSEDYNSRNDIRFANCNSLILPIKLFNDLCNTDNPQGIAAVVKKQEYDIEVILKKKNHFLVLDTIQDPGNMGTMIRTADAAGFDAVILSEGCVDIYNSKVLRATMGSIFHIPVVKSSNILTTLSSMKDENVSIYAADIRGSKSLFDEKFGKKIAIILGNEANGISKDVLNYADELLKIPMSGMAESLNASIAGGIMLYEVYRKGMEK